MNGHPLPSPSASPRRLTRRSDRKMVAGVCAGVAEHWGLDVTRVRLVLVAAVVLSTGAALALYLAGWLLLPRE